MDWISFLIGVAIGLVLFGAVLYRLGRKAAERVIAGKMW